MRFLVPFTYFLLGALFRAFSSGLADEVFECYRWQFLLKKFMIFFPSDALYVARHLGYPNARLGTLVNKLKVFQL